MPNCADSERKFTATTGSWSIPKPSYLPPWHLYQFRFALYGFADLGILGYNGNLFKNGFYSTIGIGVRIKNEHLIFRTINIRLGFAVGRTGLLNANYFHINTEDKRQPIRYRPQKATVTDYEDNTWYGWD